MAEPLASLLQALTLAFQCGMVGGVVFTMAVADKVWRGPIMGYAGMAALGAAAAAATTTAVLVHQLMSALELPLGDALGSGFAIHHVAFVGATLLAATLCICRRRQPWLAMAAALAAIAISVLGGHAASRLEGQGMAMAADFVHQVSAGAWLGGIPCLLLILRSPDGAARSRQCRRFSVVAMSSVALLAASAALLSRMHVGGWAAMTGSDFGAMATAKAILFGGMLVLGYGNLRSGARLDQPEPLARVRSFATAEVAVGFAILAVAASLSALPPPVNVADQTVPLAEVLDRLAPQGLPSFPAAAHRWSGIVVLAMGLIAFASRIPGAGWARHWPLLFLAMAAGFLLHGFRGEPGTVGEVIGPRLAAVLTAGFGVMEWAVQTGRLRHPGARLVFPILCAAGSVLLFTLGHAGADPPTALPSRLWHVAIAILLLAGGAARWVELTADSAARRPAAWIWPASFALIGILLTLYRET